MTRRTSGWARVVALVTLVAVAPISSTACFGNFGLVRRLYEFNYDVHEDKWVREAVFLVLNFPFVPIYGIATFLDAVVFNSVEFWTEESILAVDATNTVRGTNGEVASATWHPDGSVDVTLTEPDGTVHTVKIVREGETLAAFDPDGNVIARVAEVDGRPTVIDAVHTEQ